jgi:hypothetical protein
MPPPRIHWTPDLILAYCYPDPTTGCWYWLRGRNSMGYGYAQFNGAAISAHRLSYALHNGPIPAGYVVRHMCDTPACVNPWHLLLGTYADNTQDAKRRNRLKHHFQRPGAASAASKSVSSEAKRRAAFLSLQSRRANKLARQAQEAA